jgi:tripartite-type tricarboxylate transporter receptor subunit TctC
MRTALRFAVTAIAGVLVTILATGATAAWPEKPIKIIVAYSPGGGTDIVARAMAPFIEKYLGGGVRIVLDNRPGAGGAIGFAALAAAPADGYTIGFINTPNVLTIPIERKTTFTWENFELLGNVVDDPGNFSVHASSSIKNLKDLAAYAKSKPGQVTVGTTGVGSDDHLAMMLFERAAGVKMNHVPYKGAADVRTAIISQQIDVAAINVGEALQAIKGGGAIRNLGQMSPARTNLSPDLPTFREQGYDIELSSLRGIAAPKGLPADVRERLVKAVEKAAADPEFQKQAVQYYAPLRFLAPPAYAKVLKDADAGFQQLWKEFPWTDK